MKTAFRWTSLAILSVSMMCGNVLAAGRHTNAVRCQTESFCNCWRNSKFNPHTWCVPYDDLEKMTICSGRAVPPHWVIVGRRHSTMCTGHGYNELIIQRLPNLVGAEMNICAQQPIPVGWEVIGESHTIYCPGHGVNGLRIRKMY